MSNLNRELLKALFAAVHAAPAAERRELERVLEAYTTTYHRSVRGAPILVRRLLSTLEVATTVPALRPGESLSVKICDETGRPRTYMAYGIGRKVTIPEDEETER